MANDLFDFDLGDASLGKLGDLNEYYTHQTEAESKAARGTGGFGANKFDDAAREFSRKQVSVQTEIEDRLFDVHESRSEKAQRVDERRKAPTTNDPEKWASAPDRWDYPGIDTPR